MLPLKDFRQKVKGLADLLPYAALVDRGIVMNKNGSFTAAWLCKGLDTASADPFDLDLQAQRFNHAIKLLGSGWMLHLDGFRTKHMAYTASDKSHFPNKIGRELDEERRGLFSAGVCYSTSIGLSATFLPDFYATKLAGKTTTAVDTSSAIEKALIRFKNTLLEFEEVLKPVFHMTRLSEHELDDEHGTSLRSDLLAHYQQCLNGHFLPFQVPTTPMYLDSLLEVDELIGGITPRLGQNYLAVISIDGLPGESHPCILRALDTLPITFRWNTRSILLDQYEAVKEIETYWKTWNQQVFKFIDQFISNPNARPNRDALVMREDAEQAKVEVQNGMVGACYLTSSIVLMDEDEELLHENARILRQTIRNLGFGCRIETINTLDSANK